MNTELFLTMSILCKSFKIDNDIRDYIIDLIKNDAVNNIIKLYRRKVSLNMDIFTLLIKEDEIIQTLYYNWFEIWSGYLVMSLDFDTPEKYLSYLFRVLIFIDKNLSYYYIQETGSWLDKIESIGDIYYELMVRYDIIEVCSGRQCLIVFMKS